MKKEKTKLIITLSVALLSVLTMGVATFAWYQADANITVSANEASTTITTAKPKDFIFYAYKGNTMSSWDNPGSFDNDFIQITPSNLSAQTAFIGGVGNAEKLKPGDVKTFALYFNEHTSGSVGLEITSLTSQDASALVPSSSRLLRGSSTEVNIGWAINMFSFLVPQSRLSNHKPVVGEYSTFVGTPTGTDRITLAYNDEDRVIGTKDGEDVSLDEDNQNESAIDLLPSESVNYAEGYIFYALQYSNAASVMCKEVDSSGNTVDETGVDDGENARLFVYNSSALETREWNSNCYAGLSFYISEMNFVF